jgi:hypothetical protein
MFGSSLHTVVCRRTHVVFTLFVFVFAYCCPTHIVFLYCFSSSYPMSPGSLDCTYWIAPSVLSNVYDLCYLYTESICLYPLYQCFYDLDIDFWTVLTVWHIRVFSGTVQTVWHIRAFSFYYMNHMALSIFVSSFRWDGWSFCWCWSVTVN